MLEQRAWKGVRLEATEQVLRPNVKDRDYHLSIWYHVPKKRCFVSIEYTYFAKNLGIKRWKEMGTYGGPEYFAETEGESEKGVDECIAWIQREFEVIVEIQGEKIAKGE